MSVRQQQKAATRARVIEAARDLFEEAGYEETTVRAIAARAEVSVGSVFTTFASKAELLSEVMEDRLEALETALATGAAKLKGTLAQRLSGFVRLFYAFEMRRPNLYLAYVRTAFTPGLAPSVHRFGNLVKVTEISRALLRDAIARGELRSDIDIDLMLTALSSYYLWTYRDLAIKGAGADALSARYDQLVGQLLAGVTVN